MPTKSGVLFQQVLYCKERIEEIPVERLDQEIYRRTVDRIFVEVFRDYYRELWGSEEERCPDKLEPRGGE